MTWYIGSLKTKNPMSRLKMGSTASNGTWFAASVKRSHSGAIRNEKSRPRMALVPIGIHRESGINASRRRARGSSGSAVIR